MLEVDLKLNAALVPTQPAPSLAREKARGLMGACLGAGGPMAQKHACGLRQHRSVRSFTKEPRAG
jgi:hypothetical protein